MKTFQQVEKYVLQSYIEVTVDDSHGVNSTDENNDKENDVLVKLYTIFCSVVTDTLFIIPVYNDDSSFQPLSWEGSKNFRQTSTIPDKKKKRDTPLRFSC